MIKFTDDKGAEYEEVTGWHHAHPKDGEYVIRPVKQPKWKVRVVDNAWEEGDRAIEVDLGKLSSKDQAQIIKEAVEALMTNVTDNIEFWNDFDLQYAIDKARKALEEK